MSIASARRAVSNLEALGLAERDGTGAWSCHVNGLGRAATSSQLRDSLRAALISFRPFEVVCEGLTAGESATVAVRRAGVIVGARDAGESFGTLLRWGRELGILKEDATAGFVLETEFDVGVTTDETGLPMLADVESVARARLYCAARLGREIYDYLDESDRALLAAALVVAQSDPSRSIEDSGRAAEDFLRKEASVAGLGTEAQKKSGTGQLATLLRSHDVIHSHHVNLAQAIGSLRNSQSHSKDKQTNDTWATDPATAFFAANGVLVLIRSLYSFIHKGKQIL